MAFGSRAKTDTIGMLDYSYKALQIYKEKANIAGQAKALNLIGVAYFYGSMYEDALKCFLEGEELSKSQDDKLLKISLLNNIGEVYRESEIYDRAIYYYEKAIAIIDDNYSSVHATILVNIGKVYFSRSQLSRALELYKESYDILRNLEDMISLGDVENEIGKIYSQMGDLIAAEQYYLQSINRLEKVNNKYYSIDTLINLANLYREKSNENALEYYKRAISYSEQVKSKKKLLNAYNLLSYYYEEKADFKNALKYYKKYSNTNEEILNSNLKSKLEILNIDIRNIETTGKVENIRIRLENEITRQKNELEKIKESNEMLKKKIHEDELTGIQNRRGINIFLKNLLEKSALNENIIVLFMIDIDKFKKYNDYWGHAAGDICLKKISEAIEKIKSTRNDIFGRYGGEEFTYISNPKNYEEAESLGELIRQEVEDLGLYYIDEGEHKPTTISLGGIVGRIKDFNSSVEIMELADKELYRAKNMGRNMVIIKTKNKD